jgi:hypothetical protein
LEKAEQVEFGLCTHLIKHFVAREIVHLDDNVGAQVPEAARQAAENFPSKNFEVGQRRCLDGPPGPRIGCEIGHGCLLRSEGPPSPSQHA